MRKNSTNIIVTVMLVFGHFYLLSTLANAVPTIQFVTVDTGEPKQDLVEKYGEDAVKEFGKYLSNNVRKSSDLDSEYKPRFESLNKYRQKIHLSNLDYKSKQAIFAQIREEYARLGREQYKKYQGIVELKVQRILNNLANKEALESYRGDVPNIDKIHQSLEIYACAEIVSVFEKKTNVGYVINEMEGSQYDVLGLKELEKTLLASPNRDRSFEYASIVMQSDIIPTMPYYKFLDSLIDYRLTFAEYAKFKGDPKILERLEKYRQSMCLPYAKYVSDSFIYRRK